MTISRKETAWKKSRKFGDVKGGRTFPKIANRIFNRAHSLQKPSKTDVLPIFIKDNPSKDFYFPVSETEVLERINQLPLEHRENITHIWLKKVDKEDYQNHDSLQGMFICGSGVNLIVLSAFPKDLRMIFGTKKPLKKELKLYSNWCEDLQFDEKKNFWFLQWREETIQDYYLNFLLLHEIGHFVESVYQSFWSESGERKRENFADNFARIWHLRNTETIKDF
jgi:hypothetical protein